MGGSDVMQCRRIVQSMACSLNWKVRGKGKITFMCVDLNVTVCVLYNENLKANLQHTCCKRISVSKYVVV